MRVTFVRRALALAIAGLAGLAGVSAQGGRGEAAAALAEGLAALHSFEYEDANAAFLRAQRLDPGLALAYWGEAMSYHQTLWGNEDIAGRATSAQPPAGDALRGGRSAGPRASSPRRGCAVRRR